MTKLYAFLILVWLESYASGILHPQDNPFRLVKELNGLWNFRADQSPGRNKGFDEKWYSVPLEQSGPVIPMAVPSSFNDITQDISLRDFVGWVWYECSFSLPAFPASSSSSPPPIRYVLRFDSAHYYTTVWLNGEELGSHVGGHLPFEFEVKLNPSGMRITVAVNNTLSPTTLPCGSIVHRSPPYPSGFFEQELQFDWFNYAGIDRSVYLYSTPSTYISDVTTVTSPSPSSPSSSPSSSPPPLSSSSSSSSSSSWQLSYMVEVGGSLKDVGVEAVLYDSTGSKVVARSSGSSPSGVLSVPSPNLWWPWTLNPSQNTTYRYQLRVNLLRTGSTEILDEYTLKVGFRSVRVTENQLLINNKPFYFHGVGKHEDADIRGRAFDYPTYLKDINVMKWLGVSGTRTAVYPYATEYLNMCDEAGIAVIGESPAVGLKLQNYQNATLELHLTMMKQMIGRDKNHPSVFMWSVANEPDSTIPQALDYFTHVVKETRLLDPHRLVTFFNDKEFNTDLITQLMDVVLLNRYYAWYQYPGHLELIGDLLSYDLENWYSTHKKPMMISEYGAGTVSGLHANPAMQFTEDYQSQFHAAYFKTFDKYRGKFLVGEMVWALADFMTAQTTTRVWGNRKGLFNRQRQPKPAAYLVRDRYWSMVQEGAGEGWRGVTGLRCEL